MTTTINQITATVESVNDKGVKFNGEWANYSKFTAPEAIEVASRGDVVALEIDAKGFIRRLQVVKADLTNVPGLPDDGPSETEAPARPYHEPSKDELIVRQSVLKVASEYAASRPEMKCSDLLALAERLERWVWR